MRRVFFVSIVSVSALLAGCANPGVVQLSSDTYLLARNDKAGIFGNVAKLKAEVIEDANKFAESKGKAAVPISQDSTPAYPGHFATFDYQFRLVDKDSPQAVGGQLNYADTTSGSKNNRSAVALEAEITRLDSLRKKGLLTDAEFESAKKKLLDNF